MMIVRMKKTFRERMPEWMMGGITLLWGWNAFHDAMSTGVKQHAFDRPFFAPLLAFMDQFHWGLYAMAVGVLRIGMLLWNGTAPRGSALGRAVGSWMSIVFWMGLFIGVLQLPYASGAVYTYGGLLGFDIAGLLFAASDAGIAIRVHRRLAVNGRS